MTSHADLAAQFLQLHRRDEPFIIANPWDVGTALVLQSLGFEALATTSSGFAATLGRADGRVTRDEAIDHAAALVAASEIPVSADLENCFAADATGVAETARMAVQAGLAGFSVEDFSGDRDNAIYPVGEAVERVTAAVEVAHAGPAHVVVTARAENHLHGRDDLPDTIARLQAFQEAGADVLYAPGPADIEQLRQIVSSVDLPVNVLARPGAPSLQQLAEIGVKRVSVGGGFAKVAASALVDAATQVRETGDWDFWNHTASAVTARKAWTL